MSTSIRGIGVDIAEVKRFRKLPYKSNFSFYGKVFLEAEIRYCLSKVDPYPHFAARFSAKEAIIKATNKKVSNLENIEISNSGNGYPRAKVKNIKGKILISLSHTKDQAIAIAIWLN